MTFSDAATTVASSELEVAAERRPHHVAIIMDGNGGIRRNDEVCRELKAIDVAFQAFVVSSKNPLG